MPTTITPAAEVRPDALRVGPCTVPAFLVAICRATVMLSANTESGSAIFWLWYCVTWLLLATTTLQAQTRFWRWPPVRAMVRRLHFRDDWMSSKRSLVRAN